MENKVHTYPKGCVFTTLESIKDKHVTVMGLGLNGGGEASVRFFLQHGAYVIATDMKTSEQLKPTIDRLASDKKLDLSRLTYRLGEHRIEDFSDSDCVIKNPGVKIEGNKYLAAAKAIETDISIFLHFANIAKVPIIAVTGSKGKSSTVSAIHYGLLKAGFTAFLGGNITVSPLTFLEQTNEKTPVVLELSSWQLADLRGRGCLKPKISLITKIVPDHQNWYGNMESYVADKRLIYADQDENDFSIFDADGDEKGTGPACGGTWGDLFAKESKAKVLRYSKSVLPAGISGCYQVQTDSQNKTDSNFIGKLRLPDDSGDITVLEKLAVPGSHMQTNVLNAALVMKLMGVPTEKIKQILESWPGIAHRLQFFHSWKNTETANSTDSASKTVYNFYNDSCATVPEAAAAASQAFGKPVIFITGGTDKGLEFDLLADSILCKDKATIPLKALYLLAGTGTDKLLTLLEGKNVKYSGPFNSLQELLLQLKKDLTEGAERNFAESNSFKEEGAVPVVFSPGATSFGMFTNEFDRGNKFMDGVKEIF